MDNKLEKKIISIIPSKTVRDVVNSTNHKFTDIELVQIIIEFAPSWDEMIMLLLECKKDIDDIKIKKYITQFVRNEKKQYKMLTTQEDGYIYDVIMNPDYNNENYLVPDFESAFITINNFIKHYNVKKNEYSNIEIVKRKVSKRLNSREIDKNDNLASCMLNEKKQIRRIWSNLNFVNIEKIGIELDTIKYPKIFNAGDLVYIDLIKHPYLKPWRYFNYYYDIDDKKMYGINSFDNSEKFDGKESECCFLELSSEYVEYRKIELDENGYCRYLMCHNHFDFGYLEKADLNDLPPKIKEDYEYTKTELEKLNYIKS